MDPEVTVSVRGRLFPSEGGDSDEIEVISTGEYYERKGSRYILFEERQADFDEPVRNVLKISADGVSIRKRGLVVSDLLFREGVSHVSHYVTPFGGFIMGVRAHRVSIEENGDEMVVSIGYETEINYEKTSDCEMLITVRSAGKRALEQRNC